MHFLVILREKDQTLYHFQPYDLVQKHPSQARRWPTGLVAIRKTECFLDMRSFVNVHRHCKLDKKHILTYIHIGQMDLKVKKSRF